MIPTRVAEAAVLISMFRIDHHRQYPHLGDHVMYPHPESYLLLHVRYLTGPQRLTLDALDGIAYTTGTQHLDCPIQPKVRKAQFRKGVDPSLGLRRGCFYMHSNYRKN